MYRISSGLAAAVLAAASLGAWAADDGVKAARKQAKATYEMDKKGCKGMDDRKDRDRCLFQAKAKYDQEVGEVRKMKRSQAKEDKAARAEARKADKNRNAHSGNDTASAGSQLPAPGAQADPSHPTAKREPLSGMGKSPESANSPAVGNN